VPPHVVLPDALVDPQELVPLNGPDCDEFYEWLVRDMRRHGWRGRPLLVLRRDYLYAFTGSHRIAAAREVGILVPVVYWLDSDWVTPYPASAVTLYLRAARDPLVPDPTYDDERVWWLLRMEGQSFLRNED